MRAAILRLLTAAALLGVALGALELGAALTRNQVPAAELYGPGIDYPAQPRTPEDPEYCGCILDEDW